MLIPELHLNAKRRRTASGHSFWILAGLLFLGTSAVLRADTLTLKSGDVVEGQIISETETQIEIEASLYHGTIFSRRQIDKSDIQSIIRESPEQKQEKETYAALAKYTLNPNQELTKDQYTAGIAAFEKFQAKFTNSTDTAEISKRLADWQAEATNVASGKVKFASTWMTPEEKKTQADRAQKQTAVQASQGALQSLKTQLDDLQAQRAQLDATITTTQAKLKASQANLAGLTDASGGASAGSSGGRRDLAGRLTAGINTPHVEDTAAGSGTAPNPEKAQLQSEITLYQQQIGQAQTALASLDGKIKDIQTQIPQREQDSKTALAQLSEASAQPGKATNTAVKEKHLSAPPPPPPPEPTPPWYMRVWNYFHK
jgi:chromosome segregation ATPase